MVTASSGGSTYSYAYNGLGDRLQQTTDSVTTSYVLDIAAGLTQVLVDGETTFLYGNGRIGEANGTQWGYYATDALGSVRQIVDSAGAAQFAQSYEPYGDVLESIGVGESSYGFAGEWTDSTGLQYLRARYYNTGIGRFTTRDTYSGDYQFPLTLNRWMYAIGNPLYFVDPSGHSVQGQPKICPNSTVLGPSGRCTDWVLEMNDQYLDESIDWDNLAVIEGYNLKESQTLMGRIWSNYIKIIAIKRGIGMMMSILLYMISIRLVYGGRQTESKLILRKNFWNSLERANEGFVLRNFASNGGNILTKNS